jgi:leader peptidase (prepilin peptidase)/N-methyltransferase
MEGIISTFSDESSILLLALVAIFGAVIGSFLGCCIYRIPRGRYYTFSDEELEAFGDKLPEPTPFNDPPRSTCPNCKNQLSWWHNIPLFSWLYLRGVCNFCQGSIPFRYFLVEALTSVGAVLTVLHFGLTPTSVVIFALLCALIVLTFIDIDWFILPDLITLPGSLIAVLLVALNQFLGIFDYPIASNLWESLWGFVAGAGVIWLIAKIYLLIRKIDGLGLGDVKLLMLTGILMGPSASIYSLFVGSTLGAVIGTLILWIQRKGLKHYIPFGPYLAFASVLYIFTDSLLLTLFQGFISTFLMYLLSNT